MNKFYNSVAETGLTQNGATTFTGSGNSVLDLFSMGGALRSRPDNEIYNLIDKAFQEDPNLAIKCLFYLRDIRGGQGERRTFRIGLKVLYDKYLPILKKNYMSIPEYGRWDDMFEIPDYDVKQFLKLQFETDWYVYHDMLPANISLLAKWLPSINASSKDTRKQAFKFIELFGETKESYRKKLSQLRAKLEVVERKLSANEWDEVDYEHVPSIAGLKYRKAFSKHDGTRYGEYLSQVESGEKVIHTGTLYPSDIVSKIFDSEGKDKTLELAWKNLPNYTEEGENALVVCDTSGSMQNVCGSTRPLDVAISLALYYAERNTSEWKDHFITFSNRPVLQRIVGNTLYEKLLNLNNADWEMNTNLARVFDLILDRAKATKLTDEDMPRKIYIVSDMEFDSCVQGTTNYELMKERYSKAGYTLPSVVFWNVNSMQNNVPVKARENGVALVSGYSPSLFTKLVGAKDFSPMSIMLDVLNGERYARISI